MDQWSPAEVEARIRHMRDFADRLKATGELSAEPGAGGKPIHEWLEVRPFLTEPPTPTS